MTDLEPGGFQDTSINETNVRGHRILIEQLTERELEILGLLRQGNSNQQIADKIFLGLGTVKWYNNQIYSKLQVKNRKDAVQRAETLGLLTSTPSIKRAGHNLPNTATPFIGRKSDIDEVVGLLSDSEIRLVNIVGVGGMGKTRLAIECAQQLINHYQDGVYFVSLAHLIAPGDIVTTVAENIGFVFHGHDPLDKQLIEFLKSRKMLLILDNLEHLLEGVSFLSDIIRYTSDICVLITSRERLNLHSEKVYTLRSMKVPTRETPEAFWESDAVKLFAQGASYVRRVFELKSDDRDHLARICHLTEGLPLGIELASRLVDMFSLEQIAIEIQQGIDILETELKDVPERHRSIRVTFEQTWNRLNDDERAVFMKLTVFRAGFTLSAAEAVADANIRDLRMLLQKALIQSESDGRYTIHELLRQFGTDKLVETHDLLKIQEKHANYFAGFMAERKTDIKTLYQLEALYQIDMDYENVRAAWTYTVNHENWEQLPKFLFSLKFYWDMRSLGQDAVDLLEQAVRKLESLPIDEVVELALGRVLGWQGWAFIDLGLMENSVRACEKAIKILHEHNSPEDLIAAYYHLGYAKVFNRQFDMVMGGLQDTMQLVEMLDDPYWEALFLSAGIGRMYSWTGNSEQAIAFAERGLTVAQSHGMQFLIAESYLTLGVASIYKQDHDATTLWLERALNILRLFDSASMISFCYECLGGIAIAQRDFKSAGICLREALLVKWQSNNLWSLSNVLLYIVKMFADQNKLDRAVELLALIYDSPITVIEALLTKESLRVELEGRMEPEHFVTVWRRGESREFVSVVRELLDEFAKI